MVVLLKGVCPHCKGEISKDYYQIYICTCGCVIVNPDTHCSGEGE